MNPIPKPLGGEVRYLDLYTGEIAQKDAASLVLRRFPRFAEEHHSKAHKATSGLAGYDWFRSVKETGAARNTIATFIGLGPLRGFGITFGVNDKVINSLEYYLQIVWCHGIARYLPVNRLFDLDIERSCGLIWYEPGKRYCIKLDSSALTIL